MKNIIAKISNKKAARVAGFGLLIIAIAGGFIFFVLDSIAIVPGDAAAKAFNNIRANEWLFGLFIVSVLIMVACNVVVVLALYVLLKPVKKEFALLTVAFRLINTIIFAINMVNLLIEPLLFNYIHLIGIVFYALHILVLGYLIFKSGYIPRILGVMLIIGGSLGYLIEVITFFFFPNYAWLSSPGLTIGAITEISLSIWLLLKSAKISSMIEEKMNTSEE